MKENIEGILKYRVSRRGALRAGLVLGTIAAAGLISCKDSNSKDSSETGISQECFQPEIKGGDVQLIASCLAENGYEFIDLKTEKKLNLEDFRGKRVVLTIFTPSSTDFADNLALFEETVQKNQFTVIFAESSDKPRVAKTDPNLNQRLVKLGPVVQLVNTQPERTIAGVRPGTDTPATYLIDRQGKIVTDWRGRIPPEGFSASLNSAK